MYCGKIRVILVDRAASTTLIFFINRKILTLMGANVEHGPQSRGAPHLIAKS